MYVALDVFSGGLSDVVRASLTDVPRCVIVAMALDHAIGPSSLRLCVPSCLCVKRVLRQSFRKILCSSR
jgi:hypothetical protein